MKVYQNTENPRGVSKSQVILVGVDKNQDREGRQVTFRFVFYRLGEVKIFNIVKV